MESKAAATNLSVYLALFIFAAAAMLRGVHSVVFAVEQDTYRFGNAGVPFINQFNEWGVGNPRRVAYTNDFKIGDDNLGLVCGANWLESDQGGNKPPGLYNFNCIATPSEINENMNNQGFYVGGLNLNRDTVAECTIYANREPQLCDSDIHNYDTCVPYMQCV